EHTEWTGALTLSDVSGTGDDRRAFVTVQLGPADAADGAAWFYGLAWQGSTDDDGGMVMVDMERVGDGVYRTERPLPIAGSWKTTIRLHTGSSLQVVPVYAPADPAIPAAGIPAEAEVVRSFARDKSFLQREAITDRVELERGAYAVLALLATLWLASLSWGLSRFEHGSPQPPTGRLDPRRSPVPAVGG
ncbi:MAG: hypothetical protein ACRD0U_08580, partial [Acidimicrobiales bacterium]